MANVLLISLLLVVGSVCVSAMNCIATEANPCRCEVGNITLDISDYFTYPYANIQDISKPGEYTYKFSPCETFVCVSGDKNPDAKVCQISGSTEEAVSAVGRTVISTWVIDSLNPLKFVVAIEGGDSPEAGTVRRAKFTFSYSSEQSGITMQKEDKSTAGYITYEFRVVGQQVAPAGGRSGGGGRGKDITAGPIGLSLISLFIVAVAVYFIAGGLVNYYHRGARGVEVIPNYAFWKDLPFLIKDGFLFTISPCYKGARDRISYQTL